MPSPSEKSSIGLDRHKNRVMWMSASTAVFVWLTIVVAAGRPLVGLTAGLAVWMGLVTLDVITGMEQYQ